VKLCENKMCMHHKVTMNNDVYAPYVDLYENGEFNRVNRHLYHGKNTEYFLCDACHNAVMMGKPPSLDTLHT
jgi:hypothetical protein